MRKTRPRRRLADTYTFAGFRALQHIRGLFGDPRERLVRLVRREKKRSAVLAARVIGAGTTAAPVEYATCPTGRCAFTWRSKFGGCFAAGAAR
jgi:hypothetical protein